MNTIGAEHFTTEAGRTRLRISRCRACGSGWFPARIQCSTCASRDVAGALSSSSGTAYASSVVRVGPPGFSTPFILAYVDIDGVRVLAHVMSASQALAPDTPVNLIVASITGDAHSYAVEVTR
jgi:uncharacterized OB-fold protein